MRPTGLNGLAASAPAQSNGTGVAHGEQPARAPRKPRARGPASVPAGPKLAPFMALTPRPADAAMWPVQPVIWWQPELQPGLPGASGLSVERRNKVPVPDFLYPEIVPASRAAVPAKSREELRPRLGLQVPRADIGPLGWDPRAEIPAKGKDQ